MEWPTGNVLWNLPIAHDFVRTFQLLPVHINGCGFEMKGIKGGLLQKPWTLMTTSLFIWDALRAYRCPGAAHAGLHETIEGRNAQLSALYPEMMRGAVHAACKFRSSLQCQAQKT